MNRLLLFCLFCLLASFINAQNITVTLKTVNQKGEPVATATVSILPISDTTTAQNKITDSAGIALFQLGQNALYIVRISSVEYAPLEKTINVKPGASQFRFVLQPTSKELNSVVVTARKPLMRQEDDKTIVDPEPLANASTNAFEILEKTPGLFVDQDGNIYLSSTTPARVYINGREQRMSAADIATILKSLPPNAIASIEILRMPSAKYDASGGGGIVNVVLRKGVRIGLTAALMQASTRADTVTSLSVQFEQQQWKVVELPECAGSRRNTYEELTTDRLFAPDTLLNQSALTKYPTQSYYIGYGLAYNLNEKWT
jgi:hypothetical protein